MLSCVGFRMKKPIEFQALVFDSTGTLWPFCTVFLWCGLEVKEYE